MKILLDTTAYVAFKRNRREVVEHIAGAGKILFSPVVLGELMFGFRSGTKFKKNMADLSQFLEHEAVELIPIGKVTSDRYSRIATELRSRGTPIPTNDIWIAAQATEHGAELVTLDRHFEYVSGLVQALFEE